MIPETRIPPNALEKLNLEELQKTLQCQKYKIFCDIAIDPMHPLTNYKLLDDIAMEIAQNLKIQQQQDRKFDT